MGFKESSRYSLTVRHNGTSLDDGCEASRSSLEKQEDAFKKVLEARGDELYLAIITDDKLNHWLPPIVNDGTSPAI
jgi:hypothetical protein